MKFTNTIKLLAGIFFMAGLWGCGERKDSTLYERDDQEGPTVVDLPSREALEDPLERHQEPVDERHELETGETRVEPMNGEEYERDKERRANMEDVIHTAQDHKSFKVFARALAFTELDHILDSPDEYTLFAPTDQAFNELGRETIEELFDPANKEELREILKNHIVNYYVPSENLHNKTFLNSIHGNNLLVIVEDNEIYINDAQIVELDVEANNGVIHGVDKVFLEHR
jgi:uncharacterized surface protein with fasciclin (FAS1) repeats